MSKNQVRGTASFNVEEVWDGLSRERVPLRAASRLIGKREALSNDGGSIRVYGAETRRNLLDGIVGLDFGDLPAGAVRGALGDDVLALLRGVKGEVTEGGGILEGEGLEKVKEGVVDR